MESGVRISCKVRKKNHFLRKGKGFFVGHGLIFNRINKIYSWHAVSISTCIIALCFLSAMFWACTRLPRSSDESKNTERLRSDYISSHPQGLYNSHILNGEIVKGMDFLAVLASWGLPYERRLSPEISVEYWTYYSNDREAGQATIYELIFENQRLVDWNVDKDIAGNGSYRYFAKKRPGRPDDKGNLDEDRVPLKKKP